MCFCCSKLLLLHINRRGAPPRQRTYSVCPFRYVVSRPHRLRDYGGVTTDHELRHSDAQLRKRGLTRGTIASFAVLRDAQ
jgi:hypothetical protein